MSVLSHRAAHWKRDCEKLSNFFRLDSEVYDEDGNSLSSLDYDRDQMDVRSPPSVADDVYSLYYPPEKRWLSSPFDLFFSLYVGDIHVEHLISISVRVAMLSVLCESMWHIVEILSVTFNTMKRFCFIIYYFQTCLHQISPCLYWIPRGT